MRPLGYLQEPPKQREIFRAHGCHVLDLAFFARLSGQNDYRCTRSCAAVKADNVCVECPVDRSLAIDDGADCLDVARSHFAERDLLLFAGPP